LKALLKNRRLFLGLTESLTDLSSTEWRIILARFTKSETSGWRRSAQSVGDLDTHPLIREHFGEQLQSQRTEAWKECNRAAL